MYPSQIPKWRVRWVTGGRERLCATHILPNRLLMLSAQQMLISELLMMELLEPLTSFQRICGYFFGQIQ